MSDRKSLTRRQVLQAGAALSLVPRVDHAQETPKRIRFA